MQVKDMEQVFDDLRMQGLENHVAELEIQGYTTIKQVLSAETVTRAKSAIISRVEKQTAKKVDLESGAGFEGQTYIPYMLYDDEVFENILMEARPLALITYLLGESALLSSMGCHFKGPGGDPLVLHSDNGNGMPAPFPAYSQVANVNYALTPYSREAGALALVPGSHRHARQPRFDEMQLSGDQTNTSATAMNIDPGDAVIWHGNTWHGSFAREIPGIRMNLAVYFCRQYVQTQEQHKGVVPEAVLARHDDARFRTLLGAKQPYGWQAEGPDYRLMMRNPRGLFD